MSMITFEFEKTKKVLLKILPDEYAPQVTHNLRVIVENLESCVHPQWLSYVRHIKTIYEYEKEISDWALQVDHTVLHVNHFQNVQSSALYERSRALDWSYVYNPNTRVFKTSVDYDHFVEKMQKKDQVISDREFYYFIRPTTLQENGFLEVKLADWNLLLRDLYQSDAIFTGHEICDLLSDSAEFESEQHLKKQVIDFLRIQLIYMNSLTIVEPNQIDCEQN